MTVPAAPTHHLGRWLCLRLLAISALCAFTALWLQAPGLIGSRGIAPIAEMPRWAQGLPAFWSSPGLFWLSRSDAFLHLVAGLGWFSSLALLVGVAPRFTCLLAAVCYLSFRNLDLGPVCWFNFPFDALQCEFLWFGVLLAPAVWRERLRTNGPPAWVRWLGLWLLFRLMFGPGWSKLHLGQESWRDLTAVGDFLLSMPHPTSSAAWWKDSPSLVQGLSGLTLFCELLLPFLFLIPGRTQRLAAAFGVVFMLGIQAVCNIRGFNILTIGLLALLWDDRSLRRLWPFRRSNAPTPEIDRHVESSAAAQRRPLRCAPLQCTLFAVAAVPGLFPFSRQLGAPLAESCTVARVAEQVLEPLRLAGLYDMFCIVPEQRWTLVVQASDDRTTWRDYELLGVPSRLDAAPFLFAPYHSYLGFRLWFAGFGGPDESHWLRGLQQRLLAAEPTVLALFTHCPFGDERPAHVQIVCYRYDFADTKARALGQFWRREWIAVRLASP